MNLEKLKQVARAASPGPWKDTLDGTYISAPNMRTDEDTGDFHVAMMRGWGHLQYLGHDRAVEIQKANAAHISTFNPQTILAMIEELTAHRVLNDVLSNSKITPEISHTELYSKWRKYDSARAALDEVLKNEH